MPNILARLLDRCVWLFGWFFVLAWLAAFLAFPAFKGLYKGYAPVAAGIAFGLIFLACPVRQALAKQIDQPKALPFLLSVMSLGLALRALAVAYFPIEPENDGRFYHLYARQLLEGKGYGGSAGNPSEWRAFYPPGMTFLLTGWYWLTTPTPLAGKCLNILLGTVQIGLSYIIGRKTLGERPGRWAALIAAVMPTLVFYAASLGYEILLGVIFSLMIYLSLIVVERPERSWGVAIILGFVLGFGALVKPICLPLPVMILIYWLLLGVGRRAVFLTGVVGIGMALVVGPWTWRNYQLFGEVVVVSTNGGVTFYSANNPNTEGHESAVVPFPGEVNEVARDRIRRKAAAEWIKNNPRAFAVLALRKIAYTWGTSTQIISVLSYDRLPVWQEQACMAVINVFWGGLLIACLWATWKTEVWRQRRLYVAFGLVAYLFLLHLVSEGMSRHHIPVLPILALIAASALANESNEAIQSVTH